MKKAKTKKELPMELEQRAQERTVALPKTSELLERVFSSIDILIAYLDKDFNFIKVNRPYAQADERDPEFFVGKNHFDLYPHKENEAIFRKVVASGKPIFFYEKPFEYKFSAERGTTYWNWSLQPVKEADGKVSGVVLSLINVTENKRTKENLWQTETMLRTVLEALPIGVLITDQEGKIVYCNPASQKIWTGEKYGSVRIDHYRDHRGWWEDTGKKILAKEWALARALTKGDISLNEVVKIECADGVYKTIFNSAVPLYSRNQKIMGAIAVHQDITEKKKAEILITATYDLLTLFSKESSRKGYLDSVVDLIFHWTKCRCVGIRILDKEGHIPYESYMGFSQEFWESENWLSVNRDQCACIRVVTGKPEPQDALVMTPAGSFRCDNTLQLFGELREAEKSCYRGICIKSGFLSVAIIPIGYQNKILGVIHLADESEGSVPLEVITFIERMTPLIGEAINRFNLQDALRESERRLRALSAQLLTIQEQERKRIARELHDSIAASLSAVKLSIDKSLNQIAQIPAASESLRNCLSITQQTMEELRRIMADLRPSVLDDLGIAATLRWFCREFETRYPHIRVEKKIEITEHTIPDALKTVVYRISQEAFNNIAKHSQANFVDFLLREADGRIELSIYDNGQGFDVKEVLPARSPLHGFGLSTMRERTELSGGRWEIESVVGKGTVIRASWPR